MSDTLVLYFSRSGVTEKLARQLADKLGAAFESVNPNTSYAGAGGYLKGVWQAVRGEAPRVEPARDTADYALVVIGSPVWAGRLSPPMRGRLRSASGRIRKVAAFWVSGSGASYAAVGAEIERLTGKAPMATASFSQREVGRAAGDEKLEAFAKALREPVRQAA